MKVKCILNYEAKKMYNEQPKKFQKTARKQTKD